MSVRIRRFGWIEPGTSEQPGESKRVEVGDGKRETHSWAVGHTPATVATRRGGRGQRPPLEAHQSFGGDTPLRFLRAGKAETQKLAFHRSSYCTLLFIDIELEPSRDEAGDAPLHPLPALWLRT